MRKYAAALILASTIIIGEIHTFWEHSSTSPVNWILFRQVPMSLQQNLQLALSELNFILYFVAWKLYLPNRVNRNAVTTFLCFCILDAGAYFINYKTYGYWVVYLILIIIWALLQFKKKRR